MSTNMERMSGFEATASHWIHLVGICIEIFGVFIIVAGIVWSTALYLRRRLEVPHYDQYKIRIGRSLLLGLEVLVAADIVKTIAKANIYEPGAAGWTGRSTGMTSPYPRVV